MTTKDLALNFVSQFNKPFDLNVISALIDRDPEDVKPVLDELLTAKQVRLVDPEQGIYVRNNRYNAKVGYNQKGYWRFDPSEASALLDIVEAGNYTSVRAIAQAIGRSRQWVFVYMEALASIGCVGVEGKQYKVLNRDRVKEIGKHIEPGILGNLKPKLSEAEKLRRAEEKEQRHQERLQKNAAREQALKEKLIDQAWIEYRESTLFWRITFDTFLKRKGLE